ncbi:MAG: endonuclease [Muribaculaceae bacterium]|nr:endonuclease [Muribaculaceae bacterium]
MRKLFILTTIIALGFGFSQAAVEPAGYYSSAVGKSGDALLKALHAKIRPHTKISYNGLWNVFNYTDSDEDGYLIDMYSNVRWNPKTMKTSGGYQNIGDMINREHSFPKSWWGGTNDDKYSDVFHLYPTDGYINNQRSNYPFGECANGTRLTNNQYYGKGKLGTSTFTGYKITESTTLASYSKTVFEPDDEYKGDFARTYFYMATCYNDEFGNWSSPMLCGNNTQCFSNWAIQLLMKWHRQDPVSEKEIKRNNAAYDHQKNRNPFIDHPELAEYIWGNKKGQPWSQTPQGPTILMPANGSTIDMGTVAPGDTLTTLIEVKGSELTTGINVAVQGAGFSVTPTNISAAKANNGINLTVSFISEDMGVSNGTLTISSEEITTVSVDLTAKVDIEAETPVAINATNVSNTSFTANWVEVPLAETYTLVIQPKPETPDVEVELLLDEDMTEGTSWTAGGKTYQDPGFFRLGTGSGTGSVTSPTIDLTNFSGVATAQISAKAFGSDSDVEMKVSILDNSNNTLDSKTYTLTSSLALYNVVLQGAAATGNKIKIENSINKKRVQLSNVKVYGGDATQAQNTPALAPADTTASEPITITGIDDCYYHVTGLSPLTTYIYKVKAIYVEDIESDWSNLVEVTTTEEPAVLLGDVNNDGDVDVKDVTALISYILGVTPENFNINNANVNGEGEIDVQDVTALINLILQ